jgi:hypothetical protein
MVGRDDGRDADACFTNRRIFRREHQTPTPRRALAIVRATQVRRLVRAICLSVEPVAGCSRPCVRTMLATSGHPHRRRLQLKQLGVSLVPSSQDERTGGCIAPFGKGTAGTVGVVPEAMLGLCCDHLFSRMCS